FMFGGGLFGGIAPLPHPPSGTIIIKHVGRGPYWMLLNQKQGGIMKLAGKKALITGGNSGIGFATARLFIAEGAQVAITGRDQKTLDEAVAELGPTARGYRADVTIAEDRKQLFSALARDFVRLDIVFANAGISGRTPTGAT